MKWTNQVENRILIVGTAAVMIAGFVLFLNLFIRPVYESQIKALTRQVEINNKLIEKLANDPKYAIQNDFGKMKPRDGSFINLDLNNSLTTPLLPQWTIPEKDSLINKEVKRIEPRPSFFKRLFSKKK